MLCFSTWYVWLLLERSEKKILMTTCIDISHLREKKKGRPLLLGEELNKQVPAYCFP